jgi:hypothetical protein
MLSLYLIAGTVGVMLFFIAVIAPTIFGVLSAPVASTFLRRFFPRYFLVLGITLFVAGIFAETSLVRIVSFVCAFLFVFSRIILTPVINQSADAQDQQRFKLLHGTSVLINAVQLALLVYVLYRGISMQ